MQNEYCAFSSNFMIDNPIYTIYMWIYFYDATTESMVLNNNFQVSKSFKYRCRK